MTLTVDGNWCGVKPNYGIIQIGGEYKELSSELMSATQSEDQEKNSRASAILGEVIQ